MDGGINIDPFGPKQPPPLLFVPPDDLITSPSESEPDKPKKQIYKYTPEFILSFKNKYTERPSEMKKM